jgi:hypothetical protein
MMPFSEFDDKEELTDAHGRRIESFIPDLDQLEAVNIEILENNALKEGDVFRILVNDNTRVMDCEEIEPWEKAETKTQAAYMSMKDIMRFHAGESWMEDGGEEGLSLGDALELLENRCFVQLSRLSFANIDACIKSGGRILAYMPEREWCGITGEAMPWSKDLPGMRTVAIDINEEDEIIVTDHYLGDGNGIHLDPTSLSWLGDAWMLEVYK